jgi:hypothetical protein
MNLQAALTKGLPKAYQNLAEFFVPVDEAENIAKGKNVLGNAALASLYFSKPWQLGGKAAVKGIKPLMATAAQIRALLRLQGMDSLG